MTKEIAQVLQPEPSKADGYFSSMPDNRNALYDDCRHSIFEGVTHG